MSADRSVGSGWRLGSFVVKGARAAIFGARSSMRKVVKVNPSQCCDLLDFRVGLGKYLHQPCDCGVPVEFAHSYI